MIAIALLVCVKPETADAAVNRPTLSFGKWEDSSFKSFSMKFTPQENIDGCQFKAVLTNNKTYYTEPITGQKWKKGKTYNASFVDVFPNNHVMVLYVRTFTYNSKKQKVFSPWSNGVNVTPSPVKGSVKCIPISGTTNVKLKWDKTYGSSGYNVFLTTNPSGTWYWNRTTKVTSTANTATIYTFRSKKLKKRQNYYVRVVARRKVLGSFVPVLLPASNFYNGTFVIK